MIAENLIAPCSVASELSTPSSTAEFITDKLLTVPAENILSKQYAELCESHTKLSTQMEIMKRKLYLERQQLLYYRENVYYIYNSTLKYI